MFSVQDGQSLAEIIGLTSLVSKFLSVVCPGDFVVRVARSEIACLRELHPGVPDKEIFGIIKLNASCRSQLFDVNEPEYIQNCRLRLGLEGSQ